MRYKRLENVLLAAAVAVCLSGCGNGETGAAVSEEKESAGVETTTEQRLTDMGTETEQKAVGTETVTEQKAADMGTETEQKAADMGTATEQKAAGMGTGTEQKTADMGTAAEQKAAGVETATAPNRQTEAEQKTESEDLKNGAGGEAANEELPSLCLSSEDWGLGFGEAGTQPVGNATVSAMKAYDAYYMGDVDEKVIYLTFDCGYENGNTEPILDALEKHNVPATFFVVGHFLESAPEMAVRMAEDGHAVGNHTYHHPDMADVSDLADFRKELEDVETLFREITGTELAAYYRPPAGKCVEANLKMARELGYDTIFWSLAYVDWEQDHQPDRQEALDKLTGRIHPGAVVLLHNTSSTNGEILDELLTRWEEMGYEFRPLSELVE